MVYSAERGFTIIEVMLFLGVTGALFAALMFGVSGSINQQRYRESVVSFSTFLQNEYNNVTNTDNGRGNDWGCDNSGVVTENPDQTGTQFRGTSDCVLLGKIIEIQKGENINVYSVVGHEADNTSDTSDIGTLQAYKPKVTTFDQDSDPLEWGSTVNTADQKHNPLTVNIIILRSPASGLIRVFWSQSDPIPDAGDLTSLITADNSTNKLTMCVLGDSIITATQSVSIDPRIGGPDGVSVNQADNACA